MKFKVQFSVANLDKHPAIGGKHGTERAALFSRLHQQ